MMWNNCLSLEIWGDLSKQCTLFLMKWGLARVKTLTRASELYNQRLFQQYHRRRRQIRCNMSSLSFLVPFEMQVKTPSRPRQRHLLSQLQKRKVFTPYHIFLLEPCVGTVCQHKFGIILEAITGADEGTFFSFFFPFWNAGKNAQSSSSTTSAQPASQTEGICTILHIPFGAICRDCMSTQVWYNVLSHYRCRWRNLFLLFFPPLKCRHKPPVLLVYDISSASCTNGRYLHHVTYSF